MDLVVAVDLVDCLVSKILIDYDFHIHVKGIFHVISLIMDMFSCSV